MLINSERRVSFSDLPDPLWNVEESAQVTPASVSSSVQLPSPAGRQRYTILYPSPFLFLWLCFLSFRINQHPISVLLKYTEKNINRGKWDINICFFKWVIWTSAFYKIWAYASLSNVYFSFLEDATRKYIHAHSYINPKAFIKSS